MLNAQPKQFRLTDEGVILFQPDATNPLPGQPIGRIKKGEALLKPVAEAAAEGLPEGMDREAATRKLSDWLQVYIHEVLNPLILLSDEEQIQPAARQIAQSLFEALGVLPRADLEKPISLLDEEGRRALRARKVRLGPVLVFLPLLGKPAAIRLRALLWNLWHDKTLPADVPPDGVTSISVADKEDVDPAYYRAIGYPVYGPRAIRVDMLDRLVGAVYDSADKGVFKARHEMAEWLGCPIPDLYAVLEAMDHKKIHDPADERQEEGAEPEKPQEAAGEEVKPEAITEEKAKEEIKEEAAAPAAEEQKLAPQPQEKPELATFRLRRGKAYGRPPREKANIDTLPRPDFKKQDFKKSDFKKNSKKPRSAHQEPRERIIRAVPKKKVENSPFAVLKDLNVQNKE